jgi:hypothetical protein
VPAPPAADDQIDRLLRLTRSAEYAVEEILRNIELSPMPAEDKELYRRFATPESLRQALIPVYRQIFTPEEIAAWVRFLEDGPGKGIGAKQPALFRATKEALLEWGNRVAVSTLNEKARRAVNDGKDAPPPPPPAP